MQQFDGDKIVAAVFHVILFRIAERDKLFLAVAECLDSGRIDSLFQQIFLRGQGAAFAERTVVFLAAADVAVAFDHDTGAGVALEVVCDRVQLACLGRFDAGLVEAEIDGLERDAGNRRAEIVIGIGKPGSFLGGAGSIEQLFRAGTAAGDIGISGRAGLLDIDFFRTVKGAEFF